jgi:alkanesulfonate monooxygenase SsuD/methylene tetrahydromethanopterin reductase-like flavin-dependent oxidoreductase (luciferase family)
VGEDVGCNAVKGIFLHDLELDALRASAERAHTRGVDAVFLADGPLGDAIVLAAGLAAALTPAGTPDLLLGVRYSLGPPPHRHPTVLAREMTTLDHVTGGRVLVAFMGPFTDATSEAIVLCREMWSMGIGVSEGPYFPVVGAINRPLPRTKGGPPLALDLTDGSVPDEGHLRACDLVLVPVGATPPEALPPGVEVCWVES